MQAILQPIIGLRKEITDLHGRTAVVLGGANGIGKHSYTTKQSSATLSLTTLQVSKFPALSPSRAAVSS